MQISPKDIYIFLGPSLPYHTAVQILPEVTYLEPIRCGDIFTLMRYKPKVIGIIDGYFECTAAVWHKEILQAIAQGVIVLGASSMGALRAAELYPYGMQGIGEIFKLYKDGLVQDDDEVALSHGPASLGYTPLSEPFVNIRITLEKAREQKIISKTVEGILIKIGKTLFYKERTLQKIINQIKEQQLVAFEIVTRLEAWLLKNGVIDQKRNDAVSLLTAIYQLLTTSPQALRVEIPSQPLNRSIFSRALQHKIDCKGLSFSNKLSWHEQVVSGSLRIPALSKLVSRYAYLLSFVYAMDIGDCKYFKNWQIVKSHFDLKWQQSHDCDDDFLSKFIYRLENIFIKSGIQDSAEIDKETKCMLLSLLKLSGQFSKLNTRFKELNFDQEQISFFKVQLGKSWTIQVDIAKLWKMIYSCLNERQLTPAEVTVHRYTEKFYQQRKIACESDLIYWLQSNELNITEFKQLMEMSSCFDYIITRSNLDILNVNYPVESIWWYREALLLSGFYPQIRQSVSKEFSCV